MSWSYSAWSTYDKCAAKYNYSYNLRLPRGPTGPAATRGNVIHKGIELFLQKELDALPPEIDFYTQFLTGLRDSDVIQIFPEKKIALTEKWEPTEWDAPDVWFKAIYDLLAVGPTDLAVYDWKTGKEYDDHKSQREVYGVTALHAFPVYPEVVATHVYLDSKQSRPIRIPRQLAVSGLRDIWTRRIGMMMDDTTFIPSPGWHCKYCPYSSKSGDGPCRF